MDRIDLWVELHAVEIASLQNAGSGEPTSRIRERVEGARNIQRERFAGTGYRFNADIREEDMERFCPLGEEEKKVMEQLYQGLQLSARVYHRILKVARTIADLAGEEHIRKEHLLEAAAYRPSQE